jgi:DNA topoisomerase II
MGFKTQSEINEILPEKRRLTVKTQEEEAEE